MKFGVAIFPTDSVQTLFWLSPESADAVEQGFDRYVAAMAQFESAG